MDALESELERSLEAVGVRMDAFGALPAVPFTGKPRWGASAKAAFERSLEAALARGDNRIGQGHVLLGVLGSREGSVPRALRGAGVEPAALADRTRAVMDGRQRA